MRSKLAHRLAGRGVVLSDHDPERVAGLDQMAKGVAHVGWSTLVLAVIERRDGRQHRLLGRVQGLDPLTDDPLESLGELTRHLDERLLEARDLERVVGEGLVGRLVLGQPLGPVQVEPLAGDQLRQGRELAFPLEPASPLSPSLYSRLNGRMSM